MMRAKLYEDLLLFECPGCECWHMTPVRGSGQLKWDWNGSLEKPTLHPSVHVNANGGNHTYPRCHTWVRDGKIQFLSDSTHKLAGQTVDLPEIDS